ncbi:MAG: CoA transferase [Deltaproteobacteria bacterium]|nr:CoA transferase [Deltaproteobacteria bacterium]
MDKAEGALSDIRVLDLADEKGVYCGKLLADLGADVIKIERPGGDPTRNRGPFFRDDPDPQKSLYWFQFNTNKRSITLNLETADGREIFKKLVETADVLLETYDPGYLDAFGLGYNDLKKINHGLVMASITPFGQTGPYSAFQGTDIIGQAMGGVMYLAGFPEDPPNRLYGSQAYHMASVQAASGILTALYAREVYGGGQHVDVSMQEAVAIAQESAMQTFDLRREIRQRTGSSGLVPAHPAMGTYPCKDGYINIFMLDWPTLLDWMESEGMIGDLREKHKETLDKLSDFLMIFGLVMNLEAYDKFLNEEFPPVEAGLKAFLMTKTKLELYEGAQTKRLQISMVSTVEDLLASPQLNALGYFVDVKHPELGETLKYPGAPYHLSDTPWRIEKRAPQIGEHNLDIYEKELGFSREKTIRLKQGGII